jgi:hypothetical protein
LAVELAKIFGYSVMVMLFGTELCAGHSAQLTIVCGNKEGVEIRSIVCASFIRRISFSLTCHENEAKMENRISNVGARALKVDHRARAAGGAKCEGRASYWLTDPSCKLFLVAVKCVGVCT